MLKKFEAALYNQHVRDCISKGERHRGLGEDWAEIRYIEITASSAEDARQQITRKYPASKGFVLDAIVELKVFL